MVVSVLDLYSVEKSMPFEFAKQFSGNKAKNCFVFNTFPKCVAPENIHTPTTEGIGNSRGVGGSMAQEIPERRRGEWLDKFPEGQLHVHVRHKCSKL